MPDNDLINNINNLKPCSIDDICNCFLTEDEDCFDFVRKSDVATIINNYILDELKKKEAQIKLEMDMSQVNCTIQQILRNQELCAQLRYPYQQQYVYTNLF